MKIFQKTVQVILLMLFIGNTFAQDPTTISGLVGYWPFNGNAYDESAYTNNGSGVGVSYISGKIGQAASFDGNDYISIGHSDILNPGLNNFCVSLWFKSHTNQTSVLIGKHKYDFGLGYAIMTTTDNKIFIVVSNTDAQGTAVGSLSTNTFPQNEWVHIVILRNMNENTLSYYINGELSNTHNMSSAFNGNLSCTSPMSIGNSRFSKYYFNGEIDEISIYNRVLTDSEICYLYSGLQAPEAISDLTAQDITQSTAILNWTDVTNEDNYTYNQSIDGIAFFPIYITCKYNYLYGPGFIAKPALLFKYKC